MLSDISNHSIEQDENLVKKFCKTPGTPIKPVNQTPRRSSRKRSLFKSTSPSHSEDLGPMSPLSISSNNSYESPTFSPNGKFSTPPRTPVENREVEQRGRFSARKMEIKSSLFPDLSVHTPKSHRSPATASRRSQRRTPSKRIITTEDILKDLTTPPKSSKKLNESNSVVENEGSSRVICSSTPRRRRRNDTCPLSKLGIKTISSENFYGPVPQPPKARSQLFPDSVSLKIDLKKRPRSPSLDSTISNRSFVSGLGEQGRKKRQTVFRLSNSKRSRQKGPHIGVWHGVKKPKKIKSIRLSNKHILAQKSRIMKMLETKSKPAEEKSKRLFEEKPRKREAHKLKSIDTLKCKLIDSFPHSVIKRKKLPNAASHPSSEMEISKASDIPDPNKKFMKYGTRKMATFTLSDNLKLQFSDGVMKLQSPKKRRKLYSAKNDILFDFCEEDGKDELKTNIENILSKLQDDKESPSKVVMRAIAENQAPDGFCNPNTVAKRVTLTPRKALGNIENDAGHKLITNLSSLVLCEANLNKTEENKSENTISGGNKDDLSLEKIGSLVSCSRNILSDSDETQDSDSRSPPHLNPEDGMKYDGKLYSLFYKHNWNNTSSPNENVGNRNSGKKKKIKVPDDQYLLDAGQKSIGIVTCGKCGVMYQAGDFADEATHNNFHNHLPELRFTGWANERIVGRHTDGRIIMIVSSDPKSWWHKVQKIVDIVDQELGFPEGSVDSLFYKTVYLYINDKSKQIIGCLIAEECKKGYKMYPPLDGVEVDSCSKEPSPCKVGISRIWTALNHRRQGVATRMIRSLQRTFIFGEMVPMDLIAFSVPSPSGKALAQKVTGKLDFLVYGFV